MPYNILKRIGLFISFFMLFVTATIFIVYLIIGFVDAIINWINELMNLQGSMLIHIVSISIVLIFTCGIILYILGEIVDFLFGKHPSLLLDKIDDNILSKEDKEKISVIIPAYNEEKTIERAIEAVVPFCNHVIVVNDGSQDKTKEIASQCGAVVVNHKINRGLGESLRDGIKRALSLNSQIIINFDADLQYRAEEIPTLVYHIINDDYDLIMGSRFKGKIEEMSAFKRFGNKTYTRLLRYLTRVGVSDSQTGFRAFTDEFARAIKIRGNFTYTQEMILEATSKKAKIGEVPIHFDKRLDGKSRLMNNPFHFAKSSGIFLIQVLIDLNPLKIYSIFSSMLIIIGFYLGGTEIVNWLILGDMENPILIIAGLIFIVGAIIILSTALLVSSFKGKKYD